MKVLTVDLNKCDGCRVCELACALKNTGEFNPSRARIQVMGYDEPFCLPVMCFQCDHPYCMEVCPSGAITKDEDTGVVKVSKERCVGCKMCTLACPFGNIVSSSEERMAIKCELCDGEPECALFCPTGALEYKMVDTAMMYKKKAVMNTLKKLYNEVG
jgi:carbon-monoxide dehydrogenase iron sulfur subunit